MTITDRATNIITTLREAYNGNNSFDFYVSQYISGDHNKELRREIIRLLTGEVKPLSRCGLYAVSDVMKASFAQYQLFTGA